MTPQVFAFEVWIKGRFGQLVDDKGQRSIINARTAGAARYLHFIAASEWCPDVKFIDIRARKAGPPVTSDMHRATMKNRNRPELVAGARVIVDGKPGVVVDSCSGCNFRVLLDHLRFSLNVHPTDITPEAT